MTFTEAAQREWAREMRERLPREAGHKWHHPLHLLTDVASAALGEPVDFWRDMSAEQAERVLTYVRARYPHRRDERKEEWDEGRKEWVIHD